MEVFKLRRDLLEEFKKGRLDLTTLCGETYKAIKEFRKNKNGEPPKLVSDTDKHYLDYLTYLCKLERRVDVEVQCIKAQLSNPESFRRVGEHYLNEMSKAVLEIINKMKSPAEVEDIAMGPKGTIVLLIKNSPIGRVYISRSKYMDAKEKIGKRPIKRTDHPYLKALFSFLHGEN